MTIILAALSLTGGALAAPVESVLYPFQGGSDGAFPQGSLIADKQGALYGTTIQGGSANCPNAAPDVSPGCGTVFKLTPPAKGQTPWPEAVLYSFKGGSDGANPMLANIRHHNFIPVFLFGEVDGVAYVVMEYVDGQSLRQWLSTSNDFLGRVDIWNQYSAAMRHLYDGGVFHGDPHAGNVMLQAAPRGYAMPGGSYVPVDTKYRPF